MPIKSLFLSLVLAVAPAIAFAQGCSHDNRQAMTCADGYFFDHETGQCVASASS